MSRRFGPASAFVGYAIIHGFVLSVENTRMGGECRFGQVIFGRVHQLKIAEPVLTPHQHGEILCCHFLFDMRGDELDRQADAPPIRPVGRGGVKQLAMVEGNLALIQLNMDDGIFIQIETGFLATGQDVALIKSVTVA